MVTKEGWSGVFNFKLTKEMIKILKKKSKFKFVPLLPRGKKE